MPTCAPLQISYTHCIKHHQEEDRGLSDKPTNLRPQILLKQRLPLVTNAWIKPFLRSTPTGREDWANLFSTPTIRDLGDGKVTNILCLALHEPPLKIDWWVCQYRGNVSLALKTSMLKPFQIQSFPNKTKVLTVKLDIQFLRFICFSCSKVPRTDSAAFPRSNILDLFQNITPSIGTSINLFLCPD